MYELRPLLEFLTDLCLIALVYKMYFYKVVPAINPKESIWKFLDFVDDALFVAVISTLIIGSVFILLNLGNVTLTMPLRSPE